MNKKGVVLTLAFGSALALASCGSKELDNYPWNAERSKNEHRSLDETGGEGAKDPVAMAKEMLGGMPLLLNNKEHKYQYARGNSIDVYAGYWTVTQNKFLFGPALPTTYTYNNGYQMGALGEGVQLYPAIRNAYYHAERLGVPYMKAIAMIMFNFSIQELTDIYGPLPYEDYRNDKKLPPLTYYSQRDLYMRIFAELDEALALLRQTQPSKEQLAAIEGAKGGYSRGDWRVWAKFANSIRLRMAMNIVKVDPALAQMQGEKAMMDEIGVFTDADAFDFEHNKEYCEWMGNNPLWMISEGWDDMRLGASLENILKRYNNPLLGRWFTTHGNIVDRTGASTGYTAEDQDFIGVRQGIAMINKSNKQSGYGPYSRGSSYMQTMPLPLMKRTEMLFVMAEAALRGWATPASAAADRAQDFYERGIRLAFREHGVTEGISEYLEQTEVNPVDYVDPYNPINNVAGRVSVGVAWDEDDTNEVKLEKIITQKYIAVFPCSLTTWTTFRRTGYPRLFPVYLNNWPSIDSELQIRRIPFIRTTNNAQELATVPGLLGGPDEAGTRLWWDVATDLVSDVPGDDQKKTLRRIPRNFDY